MLELLNWLLTISGVILAGLSFYILKKIKNVISRAFGMIGSVGAKAKHRNEHIAEVESVMQEGAIEMLGQKYPEMMILYRWLEENHPEVLKYLGDDPLMLFELYEKYKPLIEKFTKSGLGQTEQKTYDF